MSKVTVEAYLNFDGRCEEAVEFYTKTLGAKVSAMLRFSDAPEGECPPEETGGVSPDKIMHCCFHIGETAIMASDCRGNGKPSFEGFSLTLNLETEEEADKYFAALEDGGKVEMPLGKTFWSPKFGVIVDRFGVSWMVNVVTPCGGQP